MKKETLVILSSLIILICCLLFFDKNQKIDNLQTSEKISDITISDKKEESSELQTESQTEEVITEKVTTTIEKTSEQQVTLYDYFTTDEIYLIQRCVETETHGKDIRSKMNVASVIFNRLKHKKFPNNIKSVITAPNQFAYWRTEIEDTTIEAIELAFENDTTNGCLAFRSDIHPKQWHNWKLQFIDEAGHAFYK